MCTWITDAKQLGQRADVELSKNCTASKKSHKLVYVYMRLNDAMETTGGIWTLVELNLCVK